MKNEMLIYVHQRDVRMYQRDKTQTKFVSKRIALKVTGVFNAQAASVTRFLLKTDISLIFNNASKCLRK